jgi:outer membrane protein TolC/ABC-type uncharacterized transport system substrate-binding protein
MNIKYVVAAAVAGFLFLLPAVSPAKPRVAVISEVGENNNFQDRMINEINVLMDGRGGVDFLRQKIDPLVSGEGEKILSTLMEDDAIDCIIGMGYAVSAMITDLMQFQKPVIAAGVLDRSLQGLPITAENTSGVKNFNYLQSTFNVKKDLTVFKSLYDYTHLCVLLPVLQPSMSRSVRRYLELTVQSVAPQSTLSIIEIDPGSMTKNIPEIPLDVDAVYLLPLFPQNQDHRMAPVIQEINDRKLPSFALMGEKHVRMGAMAAIAPDHNLEALSRRLAINVLEILEGQDPGTLPVSATTYTDNFVINVETLEKIDYFPAWAALEDVRLLNMDKRSQDLTLQLKEVIIEALERNLDLLAVRTDTLIQEAESGKADAALLPQVSLSADLTRIDENRVDVAQTHPARSTLAASTHVKQVVFSDDVLANRAIQRIMIESQQYQEKAMTLDTVVTAAHAYINLLFAMSTHTIQSDNLDVTRKNLEIALTKAAVGSVDASEVSRWESEKAANQIQFNDAFRDLQLARMNLNQVLDRPITRKFTLADIGPDKGIELMITDPNVYRLLENVKQARRFSDFLIAEADRNLPELKQIQANIRSQKRQVLNRKRALFLPDINLQGSVDKVLGEYDARQKTPSDLDHPWSISLTASWPIFTGGAHKKDLAQSRYQLDRLHMEEKNLRNRFYLGVRSSMETATVSAREIALSEKRLAAAQISFDIVQAGYAEGRNSVTDLIDAQNDKVSSEHAAASAKYQFVLDFLEMERAIGRFYFLDSLDEKQAFLDRLHHFMATVRSQ